MKEFRPSDDFVSRVMERVHAHENTKGDNESRLSERLLASRPLRYAMSGGGIFLGIFLTPVVCI
ncbi:MAG TPA: hypothetical protein VF790_03510 [Dissulfurispiraceae bacterium]